MLTKKSISTPTLATCIILGSESAFAANESISSILPIWPFFAIMAVIFIFRKQLNCVPPIDIQEEPATATVQAKSITETEPDKPDAPSSESAPITTAVEIKTEPAKTEAPVEALVKPDDTIIDLKDNSEQCQGSTAKGTRCKRKTTLEDASITIDGITYLLTVCRQHNTDRLKPYSGLIK